MGDHYPSSHFLQHKAQGRLAYGENALPRLHRLRYARRYGPKGAGRDYARVAPVLPASSSLPTFSPEASTCNRSPSLSTTTCPPIARITFTGLAVAVDSVAKASPSISS